MPMGTMPSSPVLAPVTRHPHDDCLHLSRFIRITIFPSRSRSCWFLLFLWAAPAPAPPPRAFGSDAVHLSGRSSYILQVGLGTRCGIWPCPCHAPGSADWRCRCFPASSLAARCFSPHLSQRSRRLSYLMPMGTMPSSPVLAPVTRHPHDDCLHLSRFIRITIFPSRSRSCWFLLFLWAA